MSFWSGLSRAERATFFACFGGWALDAFDYQFYTFVIPTLRKEWNISAGQAGTLATAALLSSILWFAVFTCLAGLSRGYWDMFAARVLIGLGFGGEWAAGAVLMGEAIKAEHRGKAVGGVQSGWAIGWGAAAVLYTIVFSKLPEATAWRVLFFAGILPAVLVLFIRRNVEEPAVFRAARESGNRGHFLEIFSAPMLRTTVLAALLATGAQGGYYAITTWLPTFLRTERKLSVLNTGGYLGVLIFGSRAL